MSRTSDRYVSSYARGLLNAVIEREGEKALDTIHKTLDSVRILAEGESIRFFSTPAFSMEEKKKTLTSILKKGKVGTTAARFLELLLDHNRLGLLPEIVKAFDEEIQEKRNEVEANIESAFPLSKKELGDITKALEGATGKSVKPTVTVNRELIGGIVAHVGSVLYDASVRGVVERMREGL